MAASMPGPNETGDLCIGSKREGCLEEIGTGPIRILNEKKKKKIFFSKNYRLKSSYYLTFPLK